VSELITDREIRLVIDVPIFRERERSLTFAIGLSSSARPSSVTFVRPIILRRLKFSIVFYAIWYSSPSIDINSKVCRDHSRRTPPSEGG